MNIVTRRLVFFSAVACAALVTACGEANKSGAPGTIKTSSTSNQETENNTSVSSSFQTDGSIRIITP